MRQIFLLAKPKQVIDSYIDAYRNFYMSIYTDTGIWDEERILESYRSEARMRKTEIVELLRKKLSVDTVLGAHTTNQSVHISWRSKTILVKWKDDGDIRIITELKIS